VGEEALSNAGLVFHGTALLGGGAILAGLVLGSITAFVIDKNFFAAAIYSAIGGVLGFIGLIHAESVGWNVGGQIALGYLFAAVVLVVFGLVMRRRGPSDGVREDQPVAADLVGAEPGEGVPTPRTDTAPVAPVDSDAPGRPATA
jgi:AGZA family xanthine/uracil permease-like MFS transporter